MNKKYFFVAMLLGLQFTGNFANPALSETPAQNTTNSNQFWWPEQLNLAPLRAHSAKSNPLAKDFDYAKEFAQLDLAALKKDINSALTTSQDWWPADYGNYGPFFIRLAWHSAGTYRQGDGRGGAGGGQQRFDPLNSWPDNGNLDKARRLLWPIKQKYGQKISWADLMVLAGNVALENMGFKTIGFAGGRTDDWEADLVYWGPEAKFMNDTRHSGDRELKNPLAATQMGLIYVNPEGPNGNPDPIAAAKDIRTTFGRMAMNDEETVALIAGGHSFGKCHGAHKPDKCVGKEPAAASLEEQGLGWQNKCGKGNAEDTVTSGLEGAWTKTPAKFSLDYLETLFKFEWKQAKSPAGATLWIPTTEDSNSLVPDAHIKGKQHLPMMLTTDLALKFDPSYRKISERFRANPEEFKLAFAKAWFKLTHRDLGPKTRYLGADVPSEEFTWQDPLPQANYKQIESQDITKLKSLILASGLTVPELIRTAWASASTFRETDMRGGSDGARVSLNPQRNWEVNNPKELAKVLSRLEAIQKQFNKGLTAGKKVSMADTIILAGNAALEKAASDAGYKTITVPFEAGRVDAKQENTDVASFANLEPKADAFRNYYSKTSYLPPAEAMIDKANLLGLTVPEMTVLLGGMRALNTNYNQSDLGILTAKPGTLSNDFFVNLLDMSTIWKNADNSAGLYEGFDRKSGVAKWKASSVDLVFGSNSELRAIAEVYAQSDSKEKFLQDFISAWNKVMNADRFDLKR